MRRALFVGLVCVMALFFAAPAYAFDGRYSIDELSTEVSVETNGSVNVIERQVVTFNSKNTGYVWYLHAPEEGESVKVTSVRVAPVDDGGALTGDWTRLQLVDSNPARQGREPGNSAAAALRSADVQPWYSYNLSDGMMRCYFPADAGSWLIEADYAISNRVLVYRDVAELYWRYAHSSLPAGATDITMQISLPVPADATVVPGENVMAWGHGPDAGTFVVGEDGSIVYHLDSIESGEYAEAHVLFPSSWMSNMSNGASRVYSELRRQAAIAEEAEWVDAGLRGASWDYKVRVLFLAIATIVILVGAAAAARLKRSWRARRALVRACCTLAIIALAEHIFFREPFTTVFLLASAFVVGVVALWLPRGGDAMGDDTLATDLENERLPLSGEPEGEEGKTV